MNDHRAFASKKILVVEDNYLLATEICEWLQDAGAHVIGPVADAEQAFGKLDGEAVEAAVVDINLGQGPTFEIADRLSRDRIPFLFATGYDPSTIPEAFRSAPRLEKPFNGRELVGAVLALEQISPTEQLLGSKRPT